MQVRGTSIHGQDDIPLHTAFHEELCMPHCYVKKHTLAKCAAVTGHGVLHAWPRPTQVRTCAHNCIFSNQAGVQARPSKPVLRCAAALRERLSCWLPRCLGCRGYGAGAGAGLRAADGGSGALWAHHQR